MSVKVSPRGTRGINWPIPRPILGLVTRLSVASGRLTGATKSGHMLLLTTTGAKSGQPRTTPLAAFREGEGWLIVASMGGSATHPAWFFNLAKHPEAVVEVEGRKVPVRAETLHGEERAKHWQRITAERPNFAGYEKKTDREIPVVRLMPLE